MSTVININPTFLLRKVDPIKVESDYRNGRYNDVSISDIQKVNVGPVKIPTILTSDPNSRSYFYKNQNGSTKIIFTTNNSMYDTTKTTTTCFYCKKIIPKSKACGIPYKLEQKILTDGILRIFHCDSSFCSPEEVFSWLKHILSGPPRFRDPKYADSIELLHLLFSFMYPGKVLRESPPAQVIHELDEEGKTYDKHEFIPIVGVITNNTKSQYLQNQLIT